MVRKILLIALVSASVMFAIAAPASASTDPGNGGSAACDVFINNVGKTGSTIHGTFNLVCHDTPQLRTLYIAGYIARYPGSPYSEKEGECGWWGPNLPMSCSVTVTLPDIAGTQKYVFGYDPEYTWATAAPGMPAYGCGSAGGDLLCFNENHYF